MYVNNLSNNGVKQLSIRHIKVIKEKLIINANKYLPKKLLKFKLSFLNKAFRNLTDALAIKKDKKIYIKILVIIIGNTYKNIPIPPLKLYFNIKVERVVPSINPLKNSIKITINMPIIDIPKTKIIKSSNALFEKLPKNALNP